MFQSSRTYIRTINTAIWDNVFILSLLKRIVTFYYNSFVFQPNIFKKAEKLSITNSEHKNCLAFLKAAKDSNINFIY